MGHFLPNLLVSIFLKWLAPAIVGEIIGIKYYRRPVSGFCVGLLLGWLGCLLLFLFSGGKTAKE
jgi:hypothetical protein